MNWIKKCEKKLQARKIVNDKDMVQRLKSCKTEDEKSEMMLKVTREEISNNVEGKTTEAKKKSIKPKHN